MIRDNLSEIEKAQIAVAVDGEGNIGIYRNRQMRKKTGKIRWYYAPTIRITNTKKIWLEYFKNMCGGGVLAGEYCVQLTFRHQDALKLAIQIYPYLIIKKEKAMSIIKWYEYKKSIERYKMPPDLAEKWLKDNGLWIEPTDKELYI